MDLNMNMTLFSDLSFFICLAIACIPAIIIGALEKPLRCYGFAVSIIFVYLSMGHSLPALIFLGIFLAWEYIEAKVYLIVRQKWGRNARLYWVFLILSILPLCLNKYLPGSNAGFSVFGFLGISYMTFKSAQVIIQIYDGQIREVGLFPYLYMDVFFPVITSGPIDRSERFKKDMYSVPSKTEYLNQAGTGVEKILQGMVYKIVFAAVFWDLLQKYGTGKNVAGYIIYMYLYGLYLFFDFAGYSLMAVGASYIFGIRTPDNFRRPYVALDIKDFWDRWHISLSTWFRDFVFSRVTMDLMRTRKFKSHLVIASIAFFINMGVMGLWHGTAVCYILYGLYHGALLSATEIYQKKSAFYKNHRNNKAFQVLEWAVTFHLVLFGFLIFSGHLFGAA
ncbi:MAG: D-alanyl-lipoteichoic acid biosynthesis protein DltB [Lachnospiraceae bacterium]|nr:D-alanyl-lipoteichoic acid biosynthesis protein DltB [Lachnospiraceae bacterium]